MKNKGFTLIELLVVIAILGILAAVVLVAINPAKRLQSARNAGVQSDIGQTGTALETYYTEENGVYPATGSLSVLETKGHLKKLPTAPTGRPTTCDEGAGADYSYVHSSTAGKEEATVWAEAEDCANTDENYYAYFTACGKAGYVDAKPTATTVDTCPTFLTAP